jgi:hypothetical protein
MLLLLILPGCGGQVSPPDDNGTPINGENDVNDENGEDGLQLELEAWIEDSKAVFLGQSRELEGTQYILVTYGEKETGGFIVAITGYEVGEEYVEVTVNFSEPNDDEAVTMALTYPYDLLEIEATGLPVQFIAEGDEDFVPELRGIDYLQPVVARSRWILLFSPTPGSQVGRQFRVEGVGNVFEGNIQYRLKDADDTVLISGHTTAEMGNWRNFTIDIIVDEDVDVDEGLLLELFTRSAKDGSIENLIQIELELEEEP